MVPKPTAGCDPSWWFYMFRVAPELLGAGADEFAAALVAEGISAGAHYIGHCVYEYPIFVDHSAFERGNHSYKGTKYCKGMCPVAELVLNTAIVLPINQDHTDKDIEDTATAIRRLALWYRSKHSGLDGPA